MQAKSIFAALCCVALAGCAAAQTTAATTTPAPSADIRAQVMVLGVYHFRAGGSDYVENRLDDHMSTQRQAEIADALDRLERFRPTKIVIELLPEHERAFNARYQRYRAGAEALTVNEREQLGMALANRLGLDRLYAVDFASNMDFAGMLAAAEAASQTHLLEQFHAETAIIQAEQARQANLTVRERLALLNAPEALATHDGYMVMAQMGTRENPIGAREMSAWWGRNMIIYARIAQIAEPGDRILVIYGAGHKFLLDQYIRQTRDLELIDPAPYLR